MTLVDRGSRLRFPRLVVVLVVLGSLAVFIPQESRAASGGAQGLVAIRKWRPTIVPTAPDAYNLSVQVYPESATRRLYAVGMGDGFIGAYNLDTLHPLAPGLQLTGSPTAVLADGPTGGLFVALRDATTRPQLRFVLAHGSSLENLGGVDLGAALAGQEVNGIYRPPAGAVLYLLSTPFGAGGLRTGGGVTITEVDIRRPESPAVGWSTPLPSCLAASRAGGATAAAIGYASDALYFGCANPGPLSTPGPPLPRGAARLRLSGSPLEGPTPAPPVDAFELFPRDGDFASGQSYWDPGSKRLTMAALSAGAATTYVFDARTNAYVGNISTGKNLVVQAGINVLTGRYYAATGSPLFGLVAAETRATPASQGTNFPEFARDEKKNPIDGAPMGVDHVGRRLFLRYNLTTEAGRGEFLIVEDRLPEYLPPPPVDPDINTVDMPEAPGKTEATFASAAQGYGSRFRQIGGEQTLEGNITMVGADFLNSSPVGRGTRELRGAWLTHLAVLNTEAGASAISLDRDRSNTQGDLNRAHAPKPDEWPPDFSLPVGPDPFQPVVGWPVGDAYCADFGGEAATGSALNSEVKCDSNERLATAKATFSGATIGEIGVSSSSFESKAYVDAKDGSVSTVTARANGISVLGGRLQVREVTATATAAARGRKGTTRAEWSREVKGVSIDGELKCDAVCDPQAVVNAVNSALGGKVIVAFPTAEQFASDGGYEAIVKRPAAHALEEVLLNGEGNDRLFVPSMVIVVAEDGPKPARTRLDLAGVEAEAHYGIAPLAGFEPDGDGGSGIVDSLLGSGSLGGAEGGPLFGLPPSTGTGGPGIDLDGTEAAGSPRGVADAAGRLIWNGLRGFLRLFPIWALLLTPIYLSARRWLLLQRAQLVSGGTS